MKHIKMISAIIIAEMMCTGCAETKDESSVPEVTTTAATTTEATTTAATTTTVTEATTTASTDESTKPDVAPEIDKPIEDTQQPATDDNLPTDPSTVANPTLIGHESQNADGTYTAELIAGVINPGDGFTMDRDTIDYLKEHGHIASNPSQIPYSQVTVENAAKAFPYLGDFVGYVPNYIEVEPGMTADQIKSVITRNFNGMRPEEYSDRFIYSSQADYDAEMARREQQAEENRLLGEQAQDAIDDLHNGGHMLGDGGTGEGLYDYLTSLQNS